MERKDARSLVLGKARKGRFETIKVKLRNDDGSFDELEVEVREPTAEQRRRIFSAMEKDASEPAQAIAAAFEATLACTFVDGQRLFEDGDRKALSESATGVDLINQVSPVVMKLIAQAPTEAVVEKN